MLELSKDKKLSIIVTLFVFAASALLLFLKNGYLIWVSAPSFLIMAAATCVFMKKRSIHSYNKNQVLMIVSVFAVLYLTLYYLLGLEYGFVISNKGVLSFASFFIYIVPTAVIIFASELTREVILAQPIKIATPIAYAVGVISELVCAEGIPVIRSAYQLADFFGLTLFPALTASFLFTYLTKRYGKYPSIVYRSVLTLYVYLIPAFPDIPHAIRAFALLALPIII